MIVKCLMPSLTWSEWACSSPSSSSSSLVSSSPSSTLSSLSSTLLTILSAPSWVSMAWWCGTSLQVTLQEYCQDQEYYLSPGLMYLLVVILWGAEYNLKLRKNLGISDTLRPGSNSLTSTSSIGWCCL